MNKPLLSIMMPAIRPDRWDAIYSSIVRATSRTFELIIVGPYPLTPSLALTPNVKYVKDFGNPIRAHNVASMLVEGKYLTWMPDDGVFLPGSIDIMFDELLKMPENPKNIVIARYAEGGREFKKDFFLINNDGVTGGPYVSDNWYLLSQPIIDTEFYMSLGGFDCQFESMAPGCNDFSIRAQRGGAIVKLVDKVALVCSHMPGSSGDHGPMHDAQTTVDTPLYNSIQKSAEFANRVKVDINGWKKLPAVWERRFGTL